MVNLQLQLLKVAFYGLNCLESFTRADRHTHKMADFGLREKGELIATSAQNQEYSMTVDKLHGINFELFWKLYNAT